MQWTLYYYCHRECPDWGFAPLHMSPPLLEDFLTYCPHDFTAIFDPAVQPLHPNLALLACAPRTSQTLLHPALQQLVVNGGLVRHFQNPTDIEVDTSRGEFHHQVLGLQSIPRAALLDAVATTGWVAAIEV
jgi:5'-3' exonuclease